MRIRSTLAGGAALTLAALTAATLPAITRLPAGARPAAQFVGPMEITEKAIDGPFRLPENHMAAALTADALRQRAVLAALSAGVPAAQGTWSQYGRAPELDNTSDYTPIDATATMAGRVQDFATDPRTGHLFAAVGGGGIWESSNLGQSWRPLTDGLPTTTAGGVGFSSAAGGTIIDGTGDSGYSFAGLGVWRSTDNGTTWQKASGVPDGLVTFRIAVDPTNPMVVYAATSRGLYRSADDAASFTNVKLPTGTTQSGGPDCAGDTTSYQCVFENFVTGVAVRPANANGSDKGGEVLAAVGWYRGAHTTKTGWSNAPNNGIYTSPTGLPGTFTDTHADQNGFISPRSHTGYISFGDASGPAQNHDVIFAMVEDAQKVNGNLPGVDPIPGVPAVCGVAGCYTTTLGGIYMSTDFGKTWTAKEPAPETLANCPVTGTDQCLVLAAPAPLGANYGPGVQSWYNNWIHVDPTVQDASGMPTRLFFGVEEPWEVDNPAGLTFSPHSIGRYFGNGFCPYVPLGVGGIDLSKPPACPGIPDAPTTTHPDQHGSILVPDGKGGVTLVLGNDGGVYTQHVDANGSFDNAHWGQGANLGLATLLPYMAVISADGTAYAGLQDNGEIRVTPDGRTVEVFGGDGFFSAVDPHNSNIVYEEYAADQVHASTDGGHTWVEINPTDTSAQFSAPLAIDPADSSHLVTGGEFVVETTSGAMTTEPQPVTGTPLDKPTDSAQVFDTGSGNSLSAVAVQGANVYVGFCGYCYVPSVVTPVFHSGIATNVGGSAPPQSRTGNGWHIADAKGLPQRYVSSIKVDPADSKTIYVAMGNYDPGIDYRPPGAFGDDVSKLGTPGVYKSTDAGATFTNISGNLPNATANWVELRGGKVLVATNVGVFISTDLNGGTWSLLGASGSRAGSPNANPSKHFGLASQIDVTHAAGSLAASALPVVPVTSVQLMPGNPNRLLAATYGRSLWVYDFPASAAVATPPPATGVAGASGALPNTAAGAASTWLPMALSAIALAAVVATVPARRRRRRR